MIEKMDGLLRDEGVDNLNFFRKPKAMRMLTLSMLAQRLAERLDRLEDHRCAAQSEEIKQ